MRYLKALELEKKKGYEGCYDPNGNFILVDYSKGILKALLTSFHEVCHKVLYVLRVSDYVDYLNCVLQRVQVTRVWYPASDTAWLRDDGFLQPCIQMLKYCCSCGYETTEDDPVVMLFHLHMAHHIEHRTLALKFFEKCKDDFTANYVELERAHKLPKDTKVVSYEQWEELRTELET